MKRLAVILGILLFCGQVVLADETTNANPEQKFEDNRASISIQKQPTTENTQKQTVKNNWFCIVVQVNGKVLDTTLPVTQ